MKIAVTAMGPDVEGPIDPRFGRPQYFLIIDTDTMDCEPVPNPNINTTGNVGIRSAKLIGDSGAEAVITGQVGPNAFRTLSALDVRIYYSMGGTVRQAIEAHQAGRLQVVTHPGPSHAIQGLVGNGNPRPDGAGRTKVGRGRRGRMSVPFEVKQADEGQGYRPDQAKPPRPRVSEKNEILRLQRLSEGLTQQLDEINKRLQQLKAIR